jgi:flagella synthesis protein FlgN
MSTTYLLSLFNQDIATAEQLLTLIESEFAALGKQDFTCLQQVMTEKLPLLAQLEQHGKERTRKLLENNLTADLDGLTMLAAHTNHGDDLLAAGEQLNILLQRCKTANLRNGRIISSNRKFTEKMLCVIRGNEAPALYDSSGGTARPGGTRPLSQA